MRVGITYRLGDRYAPYAEAIRHVGLEPVPLHPEGLRSLTGLQGLLVSGGTDINPRRFGQAMDAMCEEPDDGRDEMEFELLRGALAQQMPVLAICRGLQLLNVAMGGDLLQHLPNTDDHRQRGVTDVHEVITKEGTKLAAITGSAYAVNSRHHQAVARVGEGLVVSARASDGVVEGLELVDYPFALAVQWHPEDRVPGREPDTLLFRAFARATGA